MAQKIQTIIRSMVLATYLLLTVAASAHAADYKSLEGVQSVKVIFDFRDAKPDNALVHLKLLHDTYKDKAFAGMGEKPDFVVVFMGGSLTLLSKDRKGHSDEELKTLAEMDKVIEAMAKDGIRLEACMFAASFFQIAPDSIAKEIHKVGNGWISSIGYQTKGYVLVPVF
jgi:intracellular sulfur oxidation DsrE/DsrF family protein